MDSEEIKTAKQLLTEAEEKLKLLKSNAQNLSMREVLTLASSIRHEVCDNHAIKTACDYDATIAQSRKSLLEDINAWQLKIIETTVNRNNDETVFLGQVEDFDKAKKAMVEMIRTEIDKHLLDESEAPKLLDGIPDCKNHIATICKVTENCEKGKFLALVLGDFQSGKSTTINALCDGCHISAVGNGTPTSAVLVMVSYGEEKAPVINWRTKDNFTPIFDRIKRIIPEYEWTSFDLSNKKERIKLTDAIELIRQRESVTILQKQIKQVLSTDDIKFLMICELILAFFGTKELQAKKASLLSISDISEITRFPEDGEKKWKKEGVKGFTIDEAIFAFIDSVSCTTPSETLKKLNCTVIDSPGLFNSAYDTMVTESAMVAAHAIIYVLPYHKAASKDVCQSLYTIKNLYPDVHKKLFIVNNVDSLKGCDFVDFNRELIKTMFGASKGLCVYDARLSYLSQLKLRFDKGLAKHTDYAHLMETKIKTPLDDLKKKHFQTFNDAWSYYIRPYMMVFDTNDASCIATYLRVSGFLRMTETLKSFIEKNKAYAIILSNALIPMRNELISIKRELDKRYVEPYTKSHEDLVALWKKRIANAETFQKSVEKNVKSTLFEEQNGITLCDRISKEEYDKLFSNDFYEEMALAIAYVLYDNKGQLLVTKTLFKKDKELFKKRFGDIAFPLIREKLTSMITYRIKNVLEQIESGQDSVIENMFAPETRNIKLKLEPEWNNLFKDNEIIKLSDYLSIPEDLKGCVIEKEAQTPDTNITAPNTSISLTLLSGLITEISVVVAGLAAMIAGYIGAILCDPTGISQTAAIISFVLLGTAGVIIESFAPGLIREKFAQALKKEVLPKLQEQAPMNFRKIVKAQITTILNRYADGRVLNIQKMKNERDIALDTNLDKEKNCFRALEIIEKIKEQVSEYDVYKDTYIKE